MSELISIITYNPEPGVLVSKFPGTRFNSLTRIIVPEDCDAVLFLNGKALDVLQTGEYTLESRNIPLAAAELGRSEGDMTEFDCGVCFVNKNAVLELEWESEQGKKGTAAVLADNSSKFVSGILAFTGLDSESVTEYLKKFIGGAADSDEAPSLEAIGAKGTVETTFVPEPEVFTIEEQAEPEQTESEPAAEQKTETAPKKSPLKAIAITAIVAGVALCIAVAVFFRPGNEDPVEEKPGTVISEGSPEIPELDREITITDIDKAQNGDFVSFGSYEQDGNADNGAEPLTWEVIGVEDGNLVLITKECIDCVPYNATASDIEWKECSLRKWLNGEFYKTAFTAEQQAQIVTTTNKNALDTNYDLENGNNTEDKVYLLSITEVKSYFSGSEALRMAKATAYALSKGIYVDETVTGCCRWWLRSPGDMPSAAAIVENDGYVANHGDGVTNTLIGVRPVIRIKL